MWYFLQAFISSAVIKRRTCPRCGHRQAHTRKKQELPVTCRVCGMKIPPPAKKS